MTRDTMDVTAGEELIEVCASCGAADCRGGMAVGEDDFVTRCRECGTIEGDWLLVPESEVDA